MTAFITMMSQWWDIWQIGFTVLVIYMVIQGLGNVALQLAKQFVTLCRGYPPQSRLRIDTRDDAIEQVRRTLAAIDLDSEEADELRGLIEASARRST